MHEHKQATERERQAEMELLSADPFDVEAQAKIAERIRQQQVYSCPIVSFCVSLTTWQGAIPSLFKDRIPFI